MAPITFSVSTAPATESKEEVYREFSGVVRFDEGSGLVYNSLTGARDILPGAAIRLLQECEKFATLEGHLQRVCTQYNVPAAQIPGLRNNLKQFVKDGFLVSREELIRQYLAGEKGESHDASATISTVGIPTCNRPDNLHACLTSFAECLGQFDRDMHFLIADDSQDDSVCASNIEALQAVKKRFGIDVSYIGKAEKEALAEALAKQSGLPRSIVDFAILNPENCPITTGANRNTLLLSTVGQPLVQADDDTLCRAAPVPNSRSHISLSSSSNLHQSWFDETLMAADDWPSVDVFSLHERFLGKSVADCVRATTADLSMDSANATLYRRMKPSGGRVLLTALGTAGDSGAGFSNLYLELEDATRARLMQSEEVYRRAFDSHRHVRGVLNPIITEAPFCVSMNLALDNRAQLPPFMPVQRIQDVIFAHLVRGTIHDAFFAFMPWTIWHGKQATTKRQLDGGRSRIGEICFTLLQSALPNCHSENTDENLRDIGTALMRIGSKTQAEFEELLMARKWSLHTSRIANLQDLLKKYGGKPSYWSNDVTAHIQDLRQAVLHPQYVVASDLAAAFGEEAARKMAPRLIYRFGELLNHWTAIRQAAADIGSGPLFARKI